MRKDRGMKRRTKWTVTAFVSILMIAAAGLWALRSMRHLPKYDYSIDEWKSEHAVYREGGFSIDDAIRDTGRTVEFMWGPYLPLQKGSYSVRIDYSAAEDQSCQATASGSMARFFDASEGILSKHLHTQVYEFEVKEDIPEFQLVFRYGGTGDFTIRSVSVTANSSRIQRTAVGFAALVLFIDALILFAERTVEEKKTILALAGITALISLPLAAHGIHAGHDLGYHYLRIEAVLQALRSGQFPARISSMVLYGLGYPFSIYYNDLFLYFPALLRLLGFSVTLAYKIYVFSINVLTVLLAYYSFRNIFKGKKTGLILTLLYASASYRLSNVYVRAAVGEYTAQAFLPLLALAVYRLLFAEDREGRGSLFRDSLILAAAVSGLLGSHVITTVTSCFMLLLVCLVCVRKMLRARVMGGFVLAVLSAVLLNVYYLVPFLDYYINVPTVIQEAAKSDLPMIQEEGVYPSQYFYFFEGVNEYVTANTEGRIQKTPGLPLMMIFLAAIYLRLFGNYGRKYDFLLLFSCLSLFIASDIFPWDRLTLHFPPWRILGQIQFPSRFLVHAVLFLTLLAGAVLKNAAFRHTGAVLVLSAGLMAFWFCGNLFDGTAAVSIYDTSGVLPTTTTPQYLMVGSSHEHISSEVRGTHMAEAAVLSRTSDRLKLYCRTDETDGPHTVDAPLYAYKGYHVLDADGQEISFWPGFDNRVNFELPDGYDGEVTVMFRDPVYWRAALWISALSLLMLSAAAAVLRKQRQ